MPLGIMTFTEELKNQYLLEFLIMLATINIICIIFVGFKLLDTKINVDNYEKLKTNYQTDMETYKKKVIELLEENEKLTHINETLFKDMIQTQHELEHLQTIYFEMEQDQNLLFRNLIPFGNLTQR